MAAEVKGMKTWSGLAKKRRRPSEYEVVTTNLQTRTRHPDQAYELSPAPDLGMNEFYKQNVSESPLQHPDWEGFRDPDEMIYRVYTRIQDQQEQYVDGLLDEHNEIGHDATLTDAWLDVLERLYTPRRFLQMALQMGAASSHSIPCSPASSQSLSLHSEQENTDGDLEVKAKALNHNLRAVIAAYMFSCSILQLQEVSAEQANKLHCRQHRY